VLEDGNMGDDQLAQRSHRDEGANCRICGARFQTKVVPTTRMASEKAVLFTVLPTVITSAPEADGNLANVSARSAG
jgi:hypothetical protein